MRIPWATMIPLAAIGAAANAGEKIDADVYISVHLSDKIHSTKMLQRNQAIVSSIFDRIGVRIRWH